MNKQVLSVLFLGAPAWFGQLTIAEKTHLNRVLRCGLYMIYGDSYRSFSQALNRAQMLSVTEQLKKIMTRFAHKWAQHNNSESGSNTDLKTWLIHTVSRPSFSWCQQEPTDTQPLLFRYSPPSRMRNTNIELSICLIIVLDNLYPIMQSCFVCASFKGTQSLCYLN